MHPLWKQCSLIYFFFENLAKFVVDHTEGWVVSPWVILGTPLGTRIYNCNFRLGFKSGVNGTGWPSVW